MGWHLQGAAGTDVDLGITQGGIRTIALGGSGQINGRVSQGNARLGEPHKLDRLLGGNGKRQGQRIGKPDIFACKDNKPARDEA